MNSSTCMKSLGARNILVIDDSPIILSMCQKELSSSTLNVLTAEGVESAKQLISDNCIDLTFIDVDLGKSCVDGITFLRELRDCCFSAPVCMLTGDDSADTLHSCLLAGANDYIWKGSETPSALFQMKQVVQNLPQKAQNTEQAILTNSFFKTQGLCFSQIKLLAVYAQHGFPDLFELADIVGTSENALVKRLSRIEKHLKLKNRAGLVQLLTILSKYQY